MNLSRFSFVIVLLLLSLPSNACISPIMEDDQNIANCQAEAAEGSEYAQFMLGLIYYNDDLIEQDIIKSLQWFTKSAEQGFVFAQYNLAVILEIGRASCRERV